MTVLVEYYLAMGRENPGRRGVAGVPCPAVHGPPSVDPDPRTQRVGLDPGYNRRGCRRVRKHENCILLQEHLTQISKVKRSMRESK